MTDNKGLTMAEQVAKAALEFQQRMTGHTPKAVSVVLGGDTLVVTLHGALTPAEEELASKPEGATRVQHYHRQLFHSSVESLRKEIRRITGVDVRQSAAEVEISTGSVVHAFTSGTTVQVYLLAQPISSEDWTRRAEREGSG